MGNPYIPFFVVVWCEGDVASFLGFMEFILYLSTLLLNNYNYEPRTKVCCAVSYVYKSARGPKATTTFCAMIIDLFSQFRS